MLQQDQPEDYIIATGTSHSLQEFVATTFAKLEMDWKDHVVQSPDLMRPTDLAISKANPAKAAQRLGWKATKSMEQVIEEMLKANL